MENIRITYKIESLEYSKVLPHYTGDKTEAKKCFSYYCDNYGACNLWELTEEFDKNQKEWDIIAENIIQTNNEMQDAGL